MLHPLHTTRRRLLQGLGATALSTLLQGKGLFAPHAAPKAKRVIYLFMSGGPAQQVMFDY